MMCICVKHVVSMQLVEYESDNRRKREIKINDIPKKSLMSRKDNKTISLKLESIRPSVRGPDMSAQSREDVAKKAEKCV